MLAFRDKARDMDGIKQKIEVVYKSILKDDFAFQFRNDDELACKLLVQSQFHKLNSEMIKELDNLHKKKMDKELKNDTEVD